MGADAEPSQGEVETEGIEWGNMIFRTEARATEAYDNRVEYDRVTEQAGSDFYTELVGGLTVENQPARYGLSAGGRYGYRFYSEQTDSNDDFYNAQMAVASGANPLTWGLSADITKSLNYNTAFDPSTGQGPDSILVDQSNRRIVTSGNVGYEKEVTEKTSLTPSYGFQLYDQDIPGVGNAKWQTHTAGLQFGKNHSEKTRFFVDGYYSYQINDDENGSIATVRLGAEGQMTDKTSWTASVGVAAAEYELSGSDQRGVFNLQAVWATTEKVSAYIFGGNDYQPGYDGGGARMVYRLGYGLNWAPVERWTVGGTVFHDYQDGIGGGVESPGVGEIRHFFTTFWGYRLTQQIQLAGSAQYINDELKVNQTVLALSLGFGY